MHSRKDFGVQRRWGGAAGLQQPAELTAPHGWLLQFPAWRAGTLLTRAFPQGLGTSPLQLAPGELCKPHLFSPASDGFLIALLPLSPRASSSPCS